VSFQRKLTTYNFFWPGIFPEIRGGQSSPEITDEPCFAGCWNNMTFCLWVAMTLFSEW
jgi:hypothetical protein